MLASLSNRFDCFVAWRYLFSRERKALVSVITIIAMGGVAVGVAALMTVLAVMDGADTFIFGKFSDLYPHVRIHPPPNENIEATDPALLERLRAMPEVQVAEPILSRKTLVRMQNAPPGAKPQLIQIVAAERVGSGTLYQLNAADDRAYRIQPGDILLGRPMIGMGGPNDQGILEIPSPEHQPKLLLTSLDNPARGAVGLFFKSIEVDIAAAYMTNLFEFDSTTAFIHPDDMRRLARVQPESADYIHVKLDNAFRADRFKAALEFAPGWRATTWGEENRELFSALKLEKLALSVILLLTIVIAAFNIIGTLILMVIEKTREVGILKAMGAPAQLIARVFLFDGLLIGVVGTLAGLALGFALCTVIGRIPLSMTVGYGIDTLPVQLRALTILAIVAASLVICALAALFPARQAARLNAIEALRFD